MYPTEIDQPALSATDHGEKMRVMVVDDEVDTVTTLVGVLQDEGYVVEGFTSGQQALSAVAAFNPHVVISDIAMPHPNGWDIGRSLRERFGNKRPVLIAISGQYTKTADSVLARINGFNYYLVKPCDPPVLLAVLEKVRDATYGPS